MPALYSHTTRADFTILTAAIYNADHLNHITNGVPAQLDDYSTNTGQMQTQTDPGEVGSESLATSLAGEIERLRYALREAKGVSNWYESAKFTLGDVPGNHILYNTGLEIFQEGTSFTNPVSGTYIADGWQATKVTSGTLDWSQDTSVVPTPAQVGAFVRASLKALVTATDVSIAATDFLHVMQPIEGYDIHPIAQRIFTLSFWVRSSVTGTFCVAARNLGADRSCVLEYTINVANTWEYKSLTFPASPSAGTWNYTNDVGIYLGFTLMAGTNFHTTPGAWNTGSFIATSNQVNWIGTASATFYLTAVKITPGPGASQWIAHPMGKEISRCERYFEKTYDIGVTPGTVTNFGRIVVYMDGLTSALHSASKEIQFRVRKGKTTPTITFYSPATGTSGKVRDAVNAADLNNGAPNSGDASYTSTHTTTIAATSLNIQWHHTINARL